MGIEFDFSTAKEIADVTGQTPYWIKKSLGNKVPFIEEKFRGGKIIKYITQHLPPEIQKALKEKNESEPSSEAGQSPIAACDQLLPVSSFSEPEKGAYRLAELTPGLPEEKSFSIEVIRDRRVQRIFKIVQDALSVPPGKKKRAWIESVALRHGVRFQSVYRYLKKYEKKDMAGLAHRKSSQPKAWSPESLEFWIGLCLKREHRKVDKTSLYYDCLLIEAEKRGWKCGSYKSALWWYKNRVTPQLLAIQRAGVRGLDNTLSGSSDWATCQTPFFLKAGEKPDLIRLNLVVEGRGKVFIKDVELTAAPSN